MTPEQARLGLDQDVGVDLINENEPWVMKNTSQLDQLESVDEKDTACLAIS